MYTCRLETPAAAMTPNITMNIPPITGDGIVVNIAATLPSMPITTIKTPLTTITMRLPTCEKKREETVCISTTLVYEVMLIYRCVSK